MRALKFKAFALWYFIVTTVIQGIDGHFFHGNDVSKTNYSCPIIKPYEWDNEKWHGLFTVATVLYNSDTPTKVQVEINFEKFVPFLYTVTLELLDSYKEVIDNVKNKKAISYRINVPLAYPTPIITRITVNRQIICFSVPGAPVTYFIRVKHTLYPYNLETKSKIPQSCPVIYTNYFPTFNSDLINTHHSNPNSGLNFFDQEAATDRGICGVPKQKSSQNDVHEQEGHPWLVAVFVVKEFDSQFACSGTLISDIYIITAGNCLFRNFANKTLAVSDLLIVLGRSNLRDWLETDSELREVSRVTIPLDYTAMDAETDLAVIKLFKPIIFTDIVRPICPWNSNDPFVGKQVSLVGWPTNQLDRVIDELQQVNVRLIPKGYCLCARNKYKYNYSKRTLCVDIVNKNSVLCYGNFSGGLYIQRKDGRWYLRGIVSTIFANRNSKKCDVVYIDVARFHDWLERVLH